LSGESTRYQVTWQPGSLAFARDPEAAPLMPAPAPPLSTPPVRAVEPPAPVPPVSDSHRTAGFRFQDLQVIGQLKNTYILAQSPEGLVLIDQHAAHERVLYENLKASPDGRARQNLLFPRVVEVSPVQAGWVGENLDLLARLGLTLEPFGGASFLVVAVPAWLAETDLEALVLDLVENLAPVKSQVYPQAVEEEARTVMACHGAIRAGQKLLPEEMASLLSQLDELPVSSHCPHGRPLWRLIPYADIRQGFRRPRS